MDEFFSFGQSTANIFFWPLLETVHIHHSVYPPSNSTKENNIIGGYHSSTDDINVPIDFMKRHIIEELKRGNAVWFGCDYGAFVNTKDGIMDSKQYNHDLLFGYSSEKAVKLNKTERLIFKETSPNHAMIFTGVDLDENGNPIKWKVQNSHGENNNAKG